MAKRYLPVNHLQTVSPCSTDWEQITGDERRRFCAGCDKHIHNLAERTRPEVEALIAATGGHFCARSGRGWLRQRLRVLTAGVRR